MIICVSARGPQCSFGSVLPTAALCGQLLRYADNCCATPTTAALRRQVSETTAALLRQLLRYADNCCATPTTAALLCRQLLRFNVYNCCATCRQLLRCTDNCCTTQTPAARVGRGASGAQTCAPRPAPPTETRAKRPRVPLSHGYPAPLARAGPAGYPDNYRGFTLITYRVTVAANALSSI